MHPLHDVTKAQVRELARELGLPSAEKPATPCLASRIPYGTAVDPTTLRRIDRAERNVRALGFPILRVRHHGIMGRLEVAEADLDRALDNEDEIVARDQAGRLRARGDRPRAVPLRPAQRGASASRSIAVSARPKRARASGVIGSSPDSRARKPASEKYVITAP